MSAIETLRQKLQRYPDLQCEETPASMTVRPASPDGFTVSLYQHEKHFTVCCDGWHEEFDSEVEALNCFGFGLSERCRLRVISRGTFDYRWTLEYQRDGHWHSNSETGLFFFPFWLRRRERYLQNHTIKVECSAK